MCGILAILLSSLSEKELRQKAMEMSKKQRHRGPDWTGIHVQRFAHGGRSILAHERLAIVDVASGEQPLLSPDGSIALCVNGEIYNHLSLRQSFSSSSSSSGEEGGETFLTHSDCEVILPLFRRAVEKEERGEGEGEKEMAEAMRRLDGMFAFVLVDEKRERILVARDPIGICSLYYGWAADGSLCFASELKSLEGFCRHIKHFPPGHFWHLNLRLSDSLRSLPQPFFTPLWSTDPHFLPPPFLPSSSSSSESGSGSGSGSEELKERVLEPLKNVVEKAVKKMMMCDVPYGVLLSGGLDSSLVAAIAAKYAAKRIEDDEKTTAWFPRLHSFSIGVEGSPDLKFARSVASFLNTVHHEWTFTPQQGIDVLSDVIYHIETYDVTTIRASTPMFLLARRIKATGIKMVLSGEGADEVFGGYLYFHKAPSARSLHEETVRKLRALHQYDCLRANKSLLAWGVEGRFPFLDNDVLDFAMTSLDPSLKLVHDAPRDPSSETTALHEETMRAIRDGDARRAIEKYVLRKAFDGPSSSSSSSSSVESGPVLPEAVLWRQKEQFSDGVGYSWIDSLRAHAEETISDAQMNAAAHLFPFNTPTTKEAYLYRSIFQSHFPSDAAVETVPGGPSIACSSSVAVEWDASWKNRADPSGRAVSAHTSSLTPSEASV